MMTAFMTGGWAALLGRLGDQLADPTSLAVLQQRLNRHGAELGGQLPEILLRSGDPEQATRQWLADRDLSHWLPQVHGGTAADGWMFEPAGWNRARGAAAMEPGEIVRTHIDGGMDALLLEGMPATIALESLEAALVAAGISLGSACSDIGASGALPMPNGESNCCGMPCRRQGWGPFRVQACRWC